MTREKCSRSEHEFEFLLYDGLRQALMALMDGAIDVPLKLVYLRYTIQTHYVCLIIYNKCIKINSVQMVL